MKKLIMIIIAVVILIANVTTLATTKKLYAETATVSASDEVIDSRGECWGYTDIPYEKGSQVYVLFDSNSTQDIRDDIIISISK